MSELPARTASQTPQRHGMFGVTGSGDTSGYGGLVVYPTVLPAATPPYPEPYGQFMTALEAAWPGHSDGLERVVIDRGEITLHVAREALGDLARALRDDPAMRFEVASSVSGADYPDDPTGRRLHVAYHLLSMSHRRRVRVEVAVTAADPHVPSVTAVWPTADWQERETWDLFGVIFDGHPGLARILMPDDWDGHPQRKDYPLGGVPVAYRGASIPPPDLRRDYA